MGASRGDELERPEATTRYKKLESFSGPMRNAATDFAKCLEEIPNKPREIQILIQALTKVASTDIKSLDVALNNFKKCIASMAIKNNDEDNLFGKEVTPTMLPPLIAKYSTFVQQTIALAEKALELNTQKEAPE
jgi:hypothetical protein